MFIIPNRDGQHLDTLSLEGLALLRKGCAGAGQWRATSVGRRCGQSCVAGLASPRPALRFGHDTRARRELTPPAARRLGLVVVRVLERRLPASLQHLGITRTAVWWHALAQLEQDAPLVAEVEQVRDGAAGLEVEITEARGGAACIALAELVGSCELRLGAVPMDAAEPERV